MKPSPRNAQSTIEYSLIAALVIAGILLAGPYTIRSINAFFKTIDQQVHDSFNEKIEQDDVAVFEVPACQCDDWQEIGCGDGEPGNCARTEIASHRTCTPDGCEPVTDQCASSALCCDRFLVSQPLLCGAAADTANGGQIEGGCEVGHVQMEAVCGEGTKQYMCSNNPHARCIFKCHPAGDPGGSVDPNAAPCPDFDKDLTASTAISYINSDETCDPKVQCQAQCDVEKGYIASDDGTFCESSCGNGRLEEQYGEICDYAVPMPPLGQHYTSHGGMTHPSCTADSTGCTDYQICQDTGPNACKEIGFHFWMHGWGREYPPFIPDRYPPSDSPINNDHFTVTEGGEPPPGSGYIIGTTDQHYLDLRVTCQDGKNFFIDRSRNKCKEGYPFCLAGAEGTPYCILTCTRNFTGTPSQGAFVCADRGANRIPVWYNKDGTGWLMASATEAGNWGAVLTGYLSTNPADGQPVYRGPGGILTLSETQDGNRTVCDQKRVNRRWVNYYPDCNGACTIPRQPVPPGTCPPNPVYGYMPRNPGGGATRAVFDAPCNNPPGQGLIAYPKYATTYSKVGCHDFLGVLWPN